MRFKELLLIGCLLFAVCVPSLRADDRSHYQAALEVLEVTKTRESMLFFTDKILQQQFASMPPGMEKYQARIRQFYYHVIDWNIVKKDYARAYQEVFSEAELRWMVKFYQSNFGKKLLKMMPVMAEKGQEIIERRIEENEGEFQQILNDIRADLQSQRPPQ